MKVCLVGSSGGHLTHLYMLKPFWKNKDHFWVTFDKEDARSLLEGEKMYPCYYPTNRSLKALIKNTKIAWNVLHKEKPDLIISCGAAVAVPFFFIGKMMGAKLVYIEVFDRIDKPTMTGKMVYLRDPAIVIRKDSITFNTACITGLEDVVYVHVMFNNDLKRIVVRGCDENDKDALRWCVAKPDKRKSRKMSCKPFATLVYQKMGWDSECRYKMLGYRITFEGETLYVFDLLVPEIFHEGQRKKNAVDSQDNAASTKPVNSRKGFYLDDIVGTFGVPVEEHRKESEVKQMDGYVSMGILTGKIAPEAGKD